MCEEVSEKLAYVAENAAGHLFGLKKHETNS
jgi:hypothetical protein